MRRCEGTKVNWVKGFLIGYSAGLIVFGMLSCGAIIYLDKSGVLGIF